MAVERRAEEPKNGAREGTGAAAQEASPNHRRDNYGRQPGSAMDEAVKPQRTQSGGTMPEDCGPFDGEQCTRT